MNPYTVTLQQQDFPQSYLLTDERFEEALADAMRSEMGEKVKRVKLQSDQHVEEETRRGHDKNVHINTDCTQFMKFKEEISEPSHSINQESGENWEISKLDTAI